MLCLPDRRSTFSFVDSFDNTSSTFMEAIFVEKRIESEAGQKLSKRPGCDLPTSRDTMANLPLSFNISGQTTGGTESSGQTLLVDSCSTNSTITQAMRALHQVIQGSGVARPCCDDSLEAFCARGKMGNPD